jgi:hypothetical protein
MKKQRESISIENATENEQKRQRMGKGNSELGSAENKLSKLPLTKKIFITCCLLAKTAEQKIQAIIRIPKSEQPLSISNSLKVFNENIGLSDKEFFSLRKMAEEIFEVTINMPKNEIEGWKKNNFNKKLLLGMIAFCDALYDEKLEFNESYFTLKFNEEPYNAAAVRRHLIESLKILKNGSFSIKKSDNTHTSTVKLTIDDIKKILDNWVLEFHLPINTKNIEGKSLDDISFSRGNLVEKLLKRTGEVGTELIKSNENNDKSVVCMTTTVYNATDVPTQTFTSLLRKYGFNPYNANKEESDLTLDFSSINDKCHFTITNRK